MHLVGMQTIDKPWLNRTQAAYTSALAAGKWNNSYSAVNYKEYWAERVQAYFSINESRLELSSPGGTSGPRDMSTVSANRTKQLHLCQEPPFTRAGSNSRLCIRDCVSGRDESFEDTRSRANTGGSRQSVQLLYHLSYPPHHHHFHEYYRVQIYWPLVATPF
jgi:hypothetical protein